MILAPGGTALEGLLEVSQDKRDMLKSTEKNTTIFVSILASFRYGGKQLHEQFLCENFLFYFGECVFFSSQSLQSRITSLWQASITTKTTAIILTTPVRRLPDENATITPRGNPNMAIIPHAQFRIGLFILSSSFFKFLRMLPAELPRKMQAGAPEKLPEGRLAKTI